MIYGTDTITNKSDRNNVTRSTWHKEKVRPKGITRETKAPDTSQTGSKIRPKLGRGRAGIRCKKSQSVADITATESQSHKISTIQNVTKDNTNFPVPKQLITNETETITRKKIQGKIGSNLSTQTQFIDLHQGKQII